MQAGPSESQTPTTAKPCVVSNMLIAWIDRTGVATALADVGATTAECSDIVAGCAGTVATGCLRVISPADTPTELFEGGFEVAGEAGPTVVGIALVTAEPVVITPINAATTSAASAAFPSAGTCPLDRPAQRWMLDSGVELGPYPAELLIKIGHRWRLPSRASSGTSARRPSCSASAARPRDSRDFTVPIGTPTRLATSSGGWSAR